MKNKFLENQKFLDEMDKFLTRLLLGLAIAFMLIVFFACGSSKSSVKNNVEEYVDESSSEVVEVEIISHRCFLEQSKIKDSYEFEFNIYDTSKPIDPSTGNPPKVADGKGKRNKEVDSSKKEAEDDSLKSDNRRNNNSEYELKDKSETSKEHKETTVPKQIGVLCAGVGLLVIVVWLLHKRFK